MSDDPILLAEKKAKQTPVSEYDLDTIVSELHGPVVFVSEVWKKRVTKQ